MKRISLSAPSYHHIITRAWALDHIHIKLSGNSQKGHISIQKCKSMMSVVSDIMFHSVTVKGVTEQLN